MAGATPVSPAALMLALAPKPKELLVTSCVLTPSAEALPAPFSLLIKVLKL